MMLEILGKFWQNYEEGLTKYLGELKENLGKLWRNDENLWGSCIEIQWLTQNNWAMYFKCKQRKLLTSKWMMHVEQSSSSIAFKWEVTSVYTLKSHQATAV